MACPHEGEISELLIDFPKHPALLISKGYTRTPRVQVSKSCLAPEDLHLSAESAERACARRRVHSVAVRDWRPPGAAPPHCYKRPQ